MSEQPNILRINREERRFLGVCAGIADYFDVPAVLVRVIFIVSTLTWPPLAVGYFLLYLALDRNITPGQVRSFIDDRGLNHFRQLNYRRPIYRDMRERRIAGLCAGIAQYLEIRPVWIRLSAILLTVFLLGPYGPLAYVIGWIAMAPNPAPPHFASRAERKEWRRMMRAERRERRRDGRSHRSCTYREAVSANTADAMVAESMSGDRVTPQHTQQNARAKAAAFEDLDQLGRTFLGLENRMRDIEAFVTSKRFRLHCEIRRA